MRRPPRLRSFVVVAAVGLAPLAACGSEGDGSSRSGDGALTVVASFYPLQWIAERVGGDAVAVENLTPSGAEPHDLELTPKDVARLGEADLVVYLSGFQAAVDDAVAEGDAAAYDAADDADLSLASAEEGGADPHFWLDPTRLAAVGDALAEQLADQAPDEAATFEANAEALRTDLEALDGDLEAGLADCASRDLVTSHAAFGYLADRYDLEQVGIAGIDPSAEPSPADLAEVADFVEANDVRTIYFETLVSPAVAETLAEETGAATAVLDPIEGLSDDSRGADYLEVMRSNLASLQSGQPCP